MDIFGKKIYDKTNSIENEKLVSYNFFHHCIQCGDEDYIIAKENS